MLSGSIGYAFTDSFQMGFGKKVVTYNFNNMSVYHELGGIQLDFFIDDYHLTLGARTAGAANNFKLNDFAFSSNSSEAFSLSSTSF